MTVYDGGKEITFEVVRDIYWDCWGKMTKVFYKDSICTGIQYPSGIVAAESSIYEGIFDIVDLKCIRIL
ncbi:MAG: hypothetical protein ACOCUI_04075 [bacterium]